MSIGNPIERRVLLSVMRMAESSIDLSWAFALFEVLGIHIAA